MVQLDATSKDACGAETHNEQAWVYIPTFPHSRFPQGYNVMFGDEDNSEWQPGVRPNLLGAQYQYRVGKIGVDSPAGWVAFVNQAVDYTFCQRFTYVDGASYPDDGASVECWTTGLGEVIDGLDYCRDPLYHVEVEVLGPLRTLAPGEAQTFDIEWYAARCPGPIVNVTQAGCCHEKLEIEPIDGGLQLFDLGHSGQEIAQCIVLFQYPIGRVSVRQRHIAQHLVNSGHHQPPSKDCCAVASLPQMSRRKGQWGLAAPKHAPGRHAVERWCSLARRAFPAPSLAA